MPIAPITAIIDDIRQGKMVILVDEEDRENEGDLVIAAEYATPEAINFMAKHGRGLICLTLTEARCQQLNLPMMVSNNGSPFGTNFTISIEAAEGVTTGISAHDRSRTIQAAVARQAKPEDIIQPGHIFPLKAQNGGVLVRAGHTEAGCDLAQLAGLMPASVICEILKDDGSMARLPDLVEFAATHQLKIGTIRDLIEYRSQTESLITLEGERPLQTPYGDFILRAYQDRATQSAHLALIKGQINAEQETWVRVHEPFSVVDLLDSQSPHSWDLPSAMQYLQAQAQGVLLLLHRTETGNDLTQRLFPRAQRSAKWDTRTYGIGAQILKDIGVGKMRVLSRPNKMPSMMGFGLEVTGFVEK